jgi:Ca2+-binding RTX toxin-like protein
VITGGAKADTIWGNLGADLLKGGAGKDVFEYQSTAESTAAARDSILDFSAGDKINLVTIDANTAAGGNDKFSFIGSGAFTGKAGELRAYQGNGGWIVEGDTNGDGLADLSIAVQTLNGHALSAADFWF